MYTYKAKLVKIIDGDTADFTVDLGFFVSKLVRVRFANINTPEINTPEGKLAATALELIFDPTKQIKLVVLGPDKYQPRWNAEVYVGDLHVNKYMVDMGYAVSYKG